MTRQDFELIAETIESANPEHVNRLYMATLFADAFVHTNENFNRSKFITACTADSPYLTRIREQQ